jgi:hypothetical protein
MIRRWRCSVCESVLEAGTGSDELGALFGAHAQRCAGKPVYLGSAKTSGKFPPIARAKTPAPVHVSELVEKKGAKA